jgi:NAD(P)-dependent dehydrogenase (short-subunit alcohol dehydrogenase family)
MQGVFYKKDTRIDGKVVIVTGANTGIGKETAIDLAKRGGKVYIACRNLTKGEAALIDIKKESSSENVHLLHLDLASMESIRLFSKKFHELENQLHILINNAGLVAGPRAMTKDGFEAQMGTNHMGHFLLTNLLLDLLKQSAPSRIVVVASIFHWYSWINKEDLNYEKYYWTWYVCLIKCCFKNSHLIFIFARLGLVMDVLNLQIFYLLDIYQKNWTELELQ